MDYSPAEPADLPEKGLRYSAQSAGNFLFLHDDFYLL